MKTSERFTNAVTKLYTAFHENRLNSLDCTACAVGNICNNTREWSDVEGFIAFMGDDMEGRRKGMKLINQTGYSVKELIKVEDIFVRKVDLKQSKDSQFRGLCAVVEYLCGLEGIPNVMDYTSLFETENDAPKHQLSEVFV